MSDQVGLRMPRTMKPRASTSFSEVEVRLMCELMDKLQRGGDVRVLVRSSPYRSLAQKFLGMKTLTQTRLIRSELDKAVKS